jgi:REP-associated tyrosine transposase
MTLPGYVNLQVDVIYNPPIPDQVDAIYNHPLALPPDASPSHPSSPQPLGWYSSGYLPHFDSTLVIQFITFRLADSLPQERLRQIEEELASVPESEQDPERRKKMEHWLDAGMGCCALKHPEVARVVQEAFLKFDGDRYKLIAWCIMPNHVHVLIEPKIRLGKIVQSWKSYTGRWAIERNEELGLGIPSVELELDTPRSARRQFWMRDYWDRFIRNEEHFRNVINYIHDNPVKAGLCSKPEDWRWSSARFFERESPENNNRGTGWKGGSE